MKRYLATVILILFASTLLFSCGKKNNISSPNSDYFSNLIKSLDEVTVLKVGQTKSVSQYKMTEQANNIYCDYLEDITFTITNIVGNSLTIQTQITSKLMSDNDSRCSARSGSDSNQTNTFNKTEQISYWKEFIQYYVDANYRCSKIKNCTLSQFIRMEDQTIDNRPYRLFVTEYTYSDGNTYVLETLVSRSSLFEGVVEYILYNKASNLWIDRRDFNYSSI